MEKKYWIGRERSAMGMARGAASADVRLIHYELAGRYSIKAAQCPTAGAAAGLERAVLHLPVPGPGPSAGQHEGPEARRDPDSSMGDLR